MEVKVYASKSTLGLITLGCLILVFVFGYLGIGKRFEDAARIKDYRYADAEVKEVSKYERRDSDGDLDYDYAAVLEIQNGRETIEIETDVVFESEPDIGEKIPVLYTETEESEYDYCLAKKDWMTGSYVPENKDYDVHIFAAIFLLAFGLIVFALMLPSGKPQGVCVGGGLLLIGIAGIVLMIAAKKFGGVFLLLFGAAGVLVLYRTLFVSPEKQKQMVEDNKNARLLIVRDVFFNKENETETVIFSLLGSDGQDSSYFSYDCRPGTFPLGDKRSVNIAKLVTVNGRRTIEQYNTLDVSTVPVEEFRELSKLEKKTFEMINKAYIVKTGAPII